MRNIFIAIALFVSFSTALCQSIDSLVKLRVDRGETPGIVVGVYKDGNTHYFVAGYSNVDKKEKVTPTTYFEIGSITKTFTCLMAAELIEKGSIALTDPIKNFMPDNVKVPEKDGKDITIGTLAGARSGLPRMPDNFNPADQANPYIDYDQEKLYDFLSHHYLAKPPGYGYEYSNLGMGLLGHVLTLQTHKTYTNLLEDLIVRPLHMNNTFLNTGTIKLTNVAQGYSAGNPVHAWTWTNNSVLAGAGGILSTAEDMMKFITANMEETGTIGKALAMTHLPRYDAGSAGMQIGMGWHIKDRKIVWHNGGTGGFRTFTGFDKEKQIAVVVLTNSTTGADDLGFYLLDPSSPLKQLRVAIAVDPKSLHEFTGEYELTPTFKLAITEKGGKLFGQATGQNPFELFAESPNKFFLKVVDVQVEFLRNNKGAVEKLLLYQNGAIQGARKIK